MVSTILAATGLAAAWAAYSYFSGLRRNILEAKRTGLPYLVYRKLVCDLIVCNIHLPTNVSNPPLQPILAAHLLGMGCLAQALRAEIMVGETHHVC